MLDDLIMVMELNELQELHAARLLIDSMKGRPGSWFRLKLLEKVSISKKTVTL
jgi:hypothetical protein